MAERGSGREMWTRGRAADALERVADEGEGLAAECEHPLDLTLLAEERVTAAEADLAGLMTAMDTRAVIEQAKGMIMITLKTDADAAFTVLVRRSQSTHVKLIDVAREIVDAGMRPPVRSTAS